MKKVDAFIRRCALGLILALGAILAPASAQAVSQPLILFSNFTSTDSPPHIGSKVVLYSAVIQPGAAIAVTRTGSNTLNLTLDSGSFATLPSQTLYVTDGKRAWEVPFFTGGTILLQNSNLIGGASTPLAVADYTTLDQQTFNAYTGSKITGLSLGMPIVWMRIADLATEYLADDGSGEDLLGGYDGLWKGAFYVTDMDRVIDNAQVFTYAQVGQVNASNLGLGSLTATKIDAQLPKIKTVSFTTDRSNYNGIMYLSALSQGTTNPMPSNSRGTFKVVANKTGTVVDVVLGTSPLKVLPPIVITDSGGLLNGSTDWKGDRGDGFFVPDGVYKASLGIHDQYGVQGVTVTTLVRVISLQMSIDNVVLSPGLINTEPSFTDAVITRAEYTLTVKREDNGNLAPSLNVLGWTLAGTVPVNEVLASPISSFPPYRKNMFNTVFSLQELDFLRQDGTVGIAFPGHDLNASLDTDQDVLFQFRGDPRFNAPHCIYGDGVGETNNPATVVDMGDGNLDNDWDTLQPLQTVVGGANPTLLQSTTSMVFHGATPAEGSYTLRIRTFLSGMDVMQAIASADADTRDYCLPVTASPVFRSYKRHFWPTARPEGDTSGQGFGIFVENNSMIFTVSKTQPPLGDTTPPLLLSSDPVAGSQVRPGDFSASKPLSVILVDHESTITSDSGATRLVLTDPNGASVLGFSSTNGGSPGNNMTLYFTPLQGLVVGGTYTLHVYACSAKCLDSTVTFTVKDETPPSVLGVELVSTTSANPMALTLGTNNYQGPYDNISEIWVRLGMDPQSINTIDWLNSKVTLYQYTGGTFVALPTSVFQRTVPAAGSGLAPTDSKIRYQLDTPIDTAGQYEIRITPISKNLSTSDTFTGPVSGFINPRFATQVNTSTLTVKYSGTTLSGLIAPFPLTVSSQGAYVTPSASTIQIVAPDFSALPSIPNMKALSGTASKASAIQFNIGAGNLFTGLQFDYDPTMATQIKLYYDDVDLPQGVSETTLAVYGYTAGGGWQQVGSNLVAAQSVATNNTMTITPANGAAAQAIYAIFYTDPTAVAGTVPTATAIAFKSTRSFNPNHANAIFRKARFFYADKPAKDIEARVFDTSGTLIRVLSVGDGISLSNAQTDAIYGTTSYYFEWDGRNDSGTLARNGLYLVRWRLTKTDGSLETQVKPVAMIK